MFRDGVLSHFDKMPTRFTRSVAETVGLDTTCRPEEVLEAKFGGMLRALSLGAPPHGGIAPGVDRIVMLLCGEENLREVVVFPMNQRAEDLLMGAPSEATPKQLRELHIRLNLPAKS
jgi:aspartyl-tRNA synthetase